jgi:hypothetical protein
MVVEFSLATIMEARRDDFGFPSFLVLFPSCGTLSFQPDFSPMPKPGEFFAFPGRMTVCRNHKAACSEQVADGLAHFKNIELGQWFGIAYSA